MAKNLDSGPQGSKPEGQGSIDGKRPEGSMGTNSQGSADPGRQDSRDSGPEVPVLSRRNTPRTLDPAALADLLPAPESDLSRCPGVDFRFAALYPAVWTVLSAGKTRSGGPRAPGEVRIMPDGAVWVISLTMPEEELTLQAEAPELSDIWEALEKRLSTRPIPWRKAGRYVRKKQLSPKKPPLTKGG